MIDIHSHLIYGIDDGSDCMEQSVKMIKEAKQSGIHTIIATPHYHAKVFNIDKVTEYYNNLSNRATDSGIEIKVGFEVFINADTINTSLNHVTLSNTRYILIEFPYNSALDDSFEYIQNIINRNLIPVIAHPERNRMLMKDPERFAELVRKTGSYIQVDAASIIGVYGLQVKEYVKRLMKMKIADFVASNAHHPKDYSVNFQNSIVKLYQWCDQKYIDELLFKNAIGLLASSALGDIKAINT